MARWNKDRRLLEHEPAGYRRFQMIDSEDPNLMRDIFPYFEICRTDFDHQITTIDPAKFFLITDTHLPDGQQARPPYTVQQIVEIYDLLHRLGGPRGIIRQSEFFLYSRHDREAVEKCLELEHEYPEITGWIRAVPEDLKLVKEIGIGGNRRSDLRVRLPYLSQTGIDPFPGPGPVSHHRPAKPWNWALFPGATSKTSPGPTSTVSWSRSPRNSRTCRIITASRSKYVFAIPWAWGFPIRAPPCPGPCPSWSVP